jgi:hypothetical protein
VPCLPFSAMPDDARLWVFPAAHALTPETARRVGQEVERFLDGWAAHGRPVQGAYELRHDRFLLVAADERATGVSGCSIDTLFRRLASLEQELGDTLTDMALVWYRDREGRIGSLSRAEFRRLAAAGEAGADTPVFDPTVASVGALRAGRFELPAAESWHARLLSAPAAP